MTNSPTPAKLKVLVFAASLRAESLNRKLAASSNKPFCDATHVSMGFSDQK